MAHSGHKKMFLIQHAEESQFKMTFTNHGSSSRPHLSMKQHAMNILGLRGHCGYGAVCMKQHAMILLGLRGQCGYGAVCRLCFYS